MDVDVNSRLAATLKVEIEKLEGSEKWLAMAPWMTEPVEAESPEAAMRKALDARNGPATR